jgi:hypothetical protein
MQANQRLQENWSAFSDPISEPLMMSSQNLWAAEMAALGFMIFWSGAIVSTLALIQMLSLWPSPKESGTSRLDSSQTLTVSAPINTY